MTTPAQRGQFFTAAVLAFTGTLSAMFFLKSARNYEPRSYAEMREEVRVAARKEELNVLSFEDFKTSYKKSAFNFKAIRRGQDYMVSAKCEQRQDCKITDIKAVPRKTGLEY